MLLRNVNLYDGLANGTRLKLKEVSQSGKVIRVELITGPKSKKDKDGNFIFSEKEREYPLFRIPCSNENDRTYKMIRKQFPVRLTYCMSINKAQGQTLQRVGLYLPNPVFSHGQLYVALSRVSRPESITVFIDGSSDTHGSYRDRMYTKNYVYTQLLREEIRKFKTSEKYMGEYPVFDDVVESDDERQSYVPFHDQMSGYEDEIMEEYYVDEEPPMLEEEPPMFEEEPPMIEEEPPMFEELPMIEEDFPMFEEEPPMFEGEVPQIDEEPPMFHELVTFDENPSVLDGEVPRNDNTPMIHDIENIEYMQNDDVHIPMLDEIELWGE